MKKLINFSLLLFTIHLSLIAISAQTEQKAELVVQTGHSNKITSITVSSDGKLFASSSFDGTIKFWDLAIEQEIKTIATSFTGIEKIMFSNDGSKIIVISRYGSVVVFEVSSGNRLFD